MIRAGAALIFVACFAAAAAAAGGQEKLLDAIWAKFSHVKSVRADFTEIKKQKAFKKDQVQKGRFFSSKEGTLIWETTSPVKSTFTVKGTT
ncbi:MAG: outer membrane lipoprotein carrier protein LolA, partial [Pseudomonadota bacterium]